jgi:hypothetical protein
MTKPFYCQICEFDGRLRNCEVAARTLPATTGRTGARNSRGPPVSSTYVSENRILGSNVYSECQPMAVKNREVIRTT